MKLYFTSPSSKAEDVSEGIVSDSGGDGGGFVLGGAEHSSETRFHKNLFDLNDSDEEDTENEYILDEPASSSLTLGHPDSSSHQYRLSSLSVPLTDTIAEFE